MAVNDRGQNLQLEEKAARMLEIYARHSFQRPREAYRVQLKVATWALRAKISAGTKRALDLTLATAILIITAPIIAITAVAIMLDSPGPIFFRQVRVGRGGRPFDCYKFRSMTTSAEQLKVQLAVQNEADGPIFKIKRDPRITHVGLVIRKLSIDELPQLINVLKGEMSIVGPRPGLPREIEMYEFEALGRLDGLPGITGLQQVSGRSDLSFKLWIELDLQYLSEQSFWADMKIILKTIPAVILGRGAY